MRVLLPLLSLLLLLSGCVIVVVPIEFFQITGDPTIDGLFSLSIAILAMVISAFLVTKLIGKFR